MSTYLSLSHSGVVALNSGLKICRFIAGWPDIEYHTIKELSLGRQEEGMRSVLMVATFEWEGKKFDIKLSFGLEETFGRSWEIDPHWDITVYFFDVPVGETGWILKLFADGSRSFKLGSDTTQEMIDSVRRKLLMKA